MNRGNVRKLTRCRACDTKEFYDAFSLGSSPLANSFLKKSELKNQERYYPLDLKLCKKCGLLQLGEIVSPDLMFRNYLYISSTSKSFRDHFDKFAKDVFKMFNLDKDDLVIDIGSNDGILLKPFKKLGVKTLGVDPAKNVARIARRNGINTLVSYFDRKTANRIVKKYGKSKIITAANVFAHTDDWTEMVNAVKMTLIDDGAFIIEAPYLFDFIQKNLFDTVYHEHLSYLAVNPLVKFFKKNNLQVFKVQKTSSHGGSIRIFIKKISGPYKVQSSLKYFLNLEKNSHLSSIKTYEKFAKNIEANKKALLRLLRGLKNRGNKIIGYGAPAKGNTLLNYFGIGPELLEFIVDDSKLKQNYYTPGTHILIISPDKLKKIKFNYLLILAWNFADSIIMNHSYLRKRGVRFIVPVPTPKIIS